MKADLILLIGLIISTHAASTTYSTAGTQCTCDKFTAQTDCTTLSSKCEWVNNTCSAMDCTTKTTLDTCNKNGCAFTTASKCETKQACSTYKYTDAASCTLIGCSGGTKGTDNLVPCADITGLLDTSKACSTYSQTDCPTAGCKWSTTCVANTCADITVQTQCTYVRGDANTDHTLCLWDTTTSKCADSTTPFTSSQCTTLTSGYYVWNADNSSCDLCTATSTSYSTIIAFAVSIFLFGY